ncbi:hypothetical protein V3C99_005173 [Haemonchus contortus]|uniref:DUF3402 domain-containing protein n=1 Tax=Haemonchus contortus TaxID=6289 RepID=A0A7I5E5L8_HAECO
MSEDIQSKFYGPTFDALREFSKRKEDSLLNVVLTRSAAELAAIVVGSSVYEVYVDLPECRLLLNAMETLKRRQSVADNLKLLTWLNKNLPTKKVSPNGKEHVMQLIDMRLFLSRCAFTNLPNAVFKPFVPIVKNFLVAKLLRLRHRGRLYTGPPPFPAENQLPSIVNAIGPMDQLARSYPHLARLKREMVANITQFTITYCLDWVCELLTIKSDSKGYVRFGYPIMKVEPDWKDTEDGPLEGPSSMDEDLYRDEQKPEYPSLSPAEKMTVSRKDRNGLREPPEQSAIHDEWSDMLNMAMSDPDLPKRYKTMIQRLVASNRELRTLLIR